MIRSKRAYIHNKTKLLANIRLRVLAKAMEGGSLLPWYVGAGSNPAIALRSAWAHTTCDAVMRQILSNIGSKIFVGSSMCHPSCGKRDCSACCEVIRKNFPAPTIADLHRASK